MSKLKQHIAFKISTLLLVLTLVTPYAVKFYHLFEDHKHEVCTERTAEHLHEKDTDCIFYKFNKVNPFNIPSSYKSYVSISLDIKKEHSYYKHLKSHQQLNFSLRAPPIA